MLFHCAVRQRRTWEPGLTSSVARLVVFSTSNGIPRFARQADTCIPSPWKDSVVGGRFPGQNILPQNEFWITIVIDKCWMYLWTMGVMGDTDQWGVTYLANGVHAMPGRIIQKSWLGKGRISCKRAMLGPLEVCGWHSHVQLFCGTPWTRAWSPTVKKRSRKAEHKWK